MPTSFWPSQGHEIAMTLPEEGPFLTGLENRTKKGNLHRKWCGMNVCVFRSNRGGFNFMIADKEGPKYSETVHSDEEWATRFLFLELKSRGLTEDTSAIKPCSGVIHGFIEALTADPDDQATRDIFADWLEEEGKFECEVLHKIPEWFGRYYWGVNRDGDGISEMVREYKTGETRVSGEVSFFIDANDQEAWLKEAKLLQVVMAYHRLSETQTRILLFQPIHTVKLGNKTFVVDPNKRERHD